MSIHDQEAANGVRIHIVSFGNDGHAAAGNLAESHLMQAGTSKHGHCIFTRLSPKMEKIDVDGMTQNADMIFMLGSDDHSDDQHTISLLINACRENSILCYAILYMKNTSDPERQISNLCRQANNILLIPSMPVVNQLGDCHLMEEAVMNITDILLGKGMGGIDLYDIRNAMQCGSTAHFSIGKAEGDGRAIEAAKQAMDQQQESLHTKSLIVTVSAGSDMTLDEFCKVGDYIDSRFNEDCIRLIGSVYCKDMARKIKVSLTALASL